MKRSSRGVASGEMLKPLKMIISTSSGGNIASAASVEGAVAPRKRPRPPEAKPSSTRVSRKARNLSGFGLVRGRVRGRVGVGVRVRVRG